MAGVTLMGDWTRAVKSLTNLASFSMLGLHKEIGDHLVASAQRRFREGTGPDGKEWEQSKRAKATGGRTLVDTARLRSSLARRAFPDRADVGTNVIYARIHQLGGKAGRGHAVKLPPRPYLGISDEDEKAITEIVETAVGRCIE